MRFAVLYCIVIVRILIVVQYIKNPVVILWIRASSTHYISFMIQDSEDLYESIRGRIGLYKGVLTPA